MKKYEGNIKKYEKNMKKYAGNMKIKTLPIYGLWELPVTTQPSLFLSPVSVEASSTSFLLDIAESSNRQV